MRLTFSGKVLMRGSPAWDAVLLGSVLVVPLCGCGEAPAPAPAERLDAAAVPVVESDSPSWRAESAWRVDSVPVVRIGVQDGAEAYQFFRLSDATRLADGGIVASNAGTGELRFYGPGGEFIRSAGGRGAGPGEFAEFSSMWLCPAPGDRLLVGDNGNDRVNVFTMAGDPVATFRLRPAGAGRPPVIVGCLGGGQMLGVAYPLGSTLQGDPGQVIEGLMDYVAVDLEGRVASTITRVSTRRRVVNEVDGITNYPFIPFDSGPEAAAGGGNVYVLTGGRAALEKWGVSGAPRALFVWRAPRQATAAVWDRYTETSLRHIDRDSRRRQYARFYARDLPLPDSTPALEELSVDHDGNVWARRYRLPWEEGSAWDVIDGDGTWLGTVEIPAGVTVFEIGGDYVLGRHTDVLGVQRLVIYRLTKGG